MRSLKSELVRAGIVADLDKFEEELMEDDSEMNPIQRKLILRRLANSGRERVARKASPNTQYKKLEEAMTKLEPELQLRWIHKFLKELDPRSLVMGGALDCLQFYIDDTFVDPLIYSVDGELVSTATLIEMADGAETVEQALETLRGSGFDAKEFEHAGKHSVH